MNAMKQRQDGGSPTFGNRLFVMITFTFGWFIYSLISHQILTSQQMYFTEKQIADIKHCRANIEKQEFHDLLAGIEHEAQRGEEDRVNTQLEKIEFSGKAKLVGDPTFEQTFSLYQPTEITSGLFATYKLSNGGIDSFAYIHVWVYEYEYPYTGPGGHGCFWVAFEDKNGQRWEMVVENNCRSAYNMIQRWLRAPRMVIFPDTDDYLIFKPENPSHWILHQKDPDRKIPLTNFQFLLQGEGKSSKYVIQGTTLDGEDASVFEYDYPKEYYRSLLIMKHITNYTRETNRIYNAKEVIFIEGQKRKRIRNWKNEMSTPVQLVVKMKEQRIDDIVLYSISGDRIASIDRYALFKNVKHLDSEICIIHEDERNAIFADTNCDLIKLDAWLWVNGL